MALPQGFDPLHMSLKPTKPVLEVPRNTTRTTISSSSTSRRPVYRRSLWSRFNDAIGEFGNWIADSIETIIEITSLIVVVLIGIGAIAYVINVWVEEGFWWALLAAFIVYFVAMICIGIAWYAINIVMNIVLFCLRFIFWNGWSLLATLVVAGGITIYCCVVYDSVFGPGQTVQTTEYVAPPVTTTYVCTASSVLNVRASASNNANVIGTLKAGQKIEVYNIVNGFAKFKYGTSYGYASTKYLREAN